MDNAEKDFICYSKKYNDCEFEYRHAILPAKLMKILTKGKLYTESEWRDMGLTMTTGWVHYAIYEPSPHILLFKRPFKFSYSKIYRDDRYEYINVKLPEQSQYSAKSKLYTESEWQMSGVNLDSGWQHFAIYAPEPKVLMFRRPLSQANANYRHLQGY